MKEGKIKDKDITIRADNSFAIEPLITTSFTFGAEEEVGCLYIDDDGRFKFEGDVDASAKVFFEHVIKHWLDPYIEEQIRKGKKDGQGRNCSRKPSS